MRTTIHISNIEHSSAVEAYVEKKMKSLERIVKEREEAIARVEAGLSTKHHKKGQVFFAEVTLRIKGKEFRSVETADDLYAAIDAMKDEIVDEVKSYLEKQRAVKKKGAQTVKTRMKRG